MKKPVVFIFDPKSNDLISVCGVRNVDPDKFIELSKDARRNLAKKMDEIEEQKNKEEKEYQETINNLQSQITECKRLIGYLLGKEEISDDEIDRLIGVSKESEEESNEQE